MSVPDCSQQVAEAISKAKLAKTAAIAATEAARNTTCMLVAETAVRASYAWVEAEANLSLAILSEKNANIKCAASAADAMAAAEYAGRAVKAWSHAKENMIAIGLLDKD